MSPAPRLTFDLVVGTIERTGQLDQLLTSLDAQTHRGFRVLVVDQNTDDRVSHVLERHPGVAVEHLRAQPGLSRARNVALRHLEADVVGFPDDDCTYPSDLLTQVEARLASATLLDGLTGRPADEHGYATGRWPSAPVEVTLESVWRTVVSATLFLHRRVFDEVGGFDERLGLGSGTPTCAGEEIDLVVRALQRGARVAYDPSIVVRHPARDFSAAELARLGHSEGAALGYLMAKNRLPAREMAVRLVRPLGGAVLYGTLLDARRARFHWETLRGRIEGLRLGRSSRRGR